jgi:hypothetical protein
MGTERYFQDILRVLIANSNLQAVPFCVDPFPIATPIYILVALGPYLRYRPPDLVGHAPNDDTRTFLRGDSPRIRI